MRYLLGVTGVGNQIAVTPSLSAIVVKPDIEAVLKRRASADAKTGPRCGRDVDWHGAQLGRA